ncbi:MAG: biotin--[acetyl-CoA-carboxylase] ligase [Acidobacteria bacterium]|nr:biotin--[acetyl-CoA-carboxylase] ligase [Acidobacteriota bacterium]
MLIHRPPFIIHHFTEISSTNDRLKEMVDAPEFTCVVADQQTAGRGRRAHQWYSTPGDGLYLSILLRPKSLARVSLLSLTAAIAVAETLLDRGVTGVDIKWPNDVLVNQRKVSGILAEGMSTAPAAIRLVIGIGVNLNHRSFPDSLGGIATSLAIETGVEIAVDRYREQLLDRIRHWYQRWESGASIIDRWQELSSYACGKNIIALLDDQRIEGETAGLTETGALRVKTTSGELRAIFSGEVLSLRNDTGKVE